MEPPSYLKPSGGPSPYSSGVTEAAPEGTVDGTSDERPIPLETASSKKLAISPRCPSSGEPSGGSTKHSTYLNTTAGEPESSDKD